MLISLRDQKNKLVIKDVLDLDFDMSVEQVDDKFYVNVNHKYRLDEEFTTEKAAEDQMISVAGVRNALENELRDY